MTNRQIETHKETNRNTKMTKGSEKWGETRVGKYKIYPCARTTKNNL